jgi:hypothetical protein
MGEMEGRARVIGYSSWSIRFLFMFSIMSLSASAGIHVWTKLARSSRVCDQREFNQMGNGDALSCGLPSSVSSSWMIWYAFWALVPLDGTLYFGIGSVP